MTDETFALTHPVVGRDGGDRLDYLPLAREQAARFWGKVDKSGDCWIWQAGKCKDGYGKFAITTRTTPKQVHVRAHRLAWELLHGPVPDGLLLMHECDTPACVNPAHLRPGTQAENRADCARRGRAARGEKSGMARIKESDVRQIKRLHQLGEQGVQIAKKLRVSKCCVYQVIAGRTWRHVA